MAPTKQSTQSSGDATESADQNPNTVSVSVQDQALLRALHTFIVPAYKGKDDLEQKVSGPEAAILITELKDFMLRLFEKPSSSDKIKIEVVPEKDGKDTSQDEVIEKTDILEMTKRSTNLKHILGGTADDAKRQSPNTAIGETLVTVLRNHVFNKMPIRLLSIEKHDSRFEITLLERNEITTLLEHKLRKIWKTKYPTLMLPESEEVLVHNSDKVHDLVKDVAVYAILSHTWLRSNPGEITYSDWMNQRYNSNDPGYQKLIKFCQTAFKDHDISLGWMDTICINKDSSSELDESIRSMYKWYQSSKICIVYLAETLMISEIHQDPWFTRGWTLQELLAPKVVKFYNRNWVKFEDSENDKPYRTWRSIVIYSTDSSTIVDQIQHATTISKDELLEISSASLSRRMELAASRHVTREEDTAYSLMGIFKVNIATAYGEGSDRAFHRLLEAILNSKTYGILDLFNWSGIGSAMSSFLPNHPSTYLTRSSSISLKFTRPLEPLTMTSFGLRIPVLLMPAKSTNSNSSQFKPSGNYSATVTVDVFPGFSQQYCLLDGTISGPDQGMKDESGQDIYQQTFAVFNIERRNGGVYIPQTCIAILLTCYEDAGKVTNTGRVERLYTDEPIVFKMQKRNFNVETYQSIDEPVDVDKDGIVLAEDDLAKHGMQLVIKYI